jgi:hypothetical protein
VLQARRRCSCSVVKASTNPKGPKPFPRGPVLLNIISTGKGLYLGNDGDLAAVEGSSGFGKPEGGQASTARAAPPRLVTSV